ncbi:TIGR03915 family putative DNA repair protein [Cellulosilyticum sp. I15G10I2]|uniref:TIGR03915 family putative DNA repair protein n=1 Tax=Cellulosilyticum sp. I15G10I2 TaxID=1892843 RepID=UPI00085C33D8|nr:TIGR03915 family putative DNA repair protein [Cellulosilyticum sp. I15G10I2]
MKEYVYDNSFDGLLTAIFYAYQEKCDVKLTKEASYTPNLLYEKVPIKTEQDKADRVYNSLYTKLSYATLSNVYSLYLCDMPDMDTLIFSYVKLCFKHSDTINLAKNNDIIRAVDQYARRVSLEAHRFKGFVRFKEIAPLVFYAQIEPDHNILPLIMHHFEQRFSDQHFIIHDLKREYAIVYDLKQTYLRDLSVAEGQSLSACTDVDSFETLFKSFYQSVTITTKLNEKQQRSYMPKRYWKHIIET